MGAGAILAGRKRKRAGSPAVLAKWLEPRFVITPTVALIDDVCVRAVREPNAREMLNAPPRTGKSELSAVWLPVWALGEDPDMQIMIVCNGDELAKEHSGKVRRIIVEHSARLGFSIAPDKAAVGRWLVEGRKGGMLAAGITAHIVGRGTSLLILDDVVGGASEADSEAHRRRVLNEYQGSLSTRVHPGGGQLLVMTRWHEEDLAGAILKKQPGRWRRTNVTAIGERGVPDAMGKAPGVAMVSALGYSAADFLDKRATVGERQWYAQFMGMPTNPEGGLVKQAWFDDFRLACAPANPVLTVVSVDPSDSGKGDECGLVASSLTADGVVALIADRSAQMTSDEWAKAAVRLAVEVGASEIAVEGFAARETYTRVVKEALQGVSRPIKVTSWPPKGRPRVGDAIARSSALLQALETGRAVLAGEFPKFESSAITWQSGQHQPDRLAAWVVGHDVLVHSVGRAWDIAGPPETPARAAGVVTDMSDWMSRRVG